MDRILHKTDFGFIFWCPGCGCCHGVWVNKPNDLTGARWTWNQDTEKPTFNPSVLLTGNKRCHLYVKDGTIQFLGDCSHEMANRTIPMEAF